MKSSPQGEWTCSHIPLKCLESRKKCQHEKSLLVSEETAGVGSEKCILSCNWRKQLGLELMAEIKYVWFEYFSVKRQKYIIANRVNQIWWKLAESKMKKSTKINTGGPGAFSRHQLPEKMRACPLTSCWMEAEEWTLKSRSHSRK